MQEKSPANFKLTRNLSCLDPLVIVNDSLKQANKAKFQKVLYSLIEAGTLDQSDADIASDEYETLVQQAQVSEQFRGFGSKDEDRLDSLYYSFLKGKRCYQHLWPVIGRLLVLSHGQATVERGFSTNKQVMEYNQSEGALKARRVIKDHLNHVGGTLNVVLDDELRKAVNSARNKYRTADAEKKKEAMKKMQKNCQDTIRSLNVKKRDECKKMKKDLEEEMHKLEEQYSADFNTAARTGVQSYVLSGTEKLNKFNMNKMHLKDIEEELKNLEAKLKNT